MSVKQCIMGSEFVSSMWGNTECHSITFAECVSLVLNTDRHVTRAKIFSL